MRRTLLSSIDIGPLDELAHRDPDVVPVLDAVKLFVADPSDENRIAMIDGVNHHAGLSHIAAHAFVTMLGFAHLFDVATGALEEEE